MNKDFLKNSKKINSYFKILKEFLNMLLIIEKI